MKLKDFSQMIKTIFSCLFFFCMRSGRLLQTFMLAMALYINLSYKFFVRAFVLNAKISLPSMFGRLFLYSCSLCLVSLARVKRNDKLRLTCVSNTMALCVEPAKVE